MQFPGHVNGSGLSYLRVVVRRRPLDAVLYFLKVVPLQPNPFGNVQQAQLYKMHVVRSCKGLIADAPLLLDGGAGPTWESTRRFTGAKKTLLLLPNNAMQRNATQCNAMQRNTTQCNATQCNAMQRNATFYDQNHEISSAL